MSALELPSRIPPHNLDAERAVLGAILLEGREALPRVVEVLRDSDYYTEAHPFWHQDVVVIGGKNSAAEAALDLFRAGARVTLVHRRAQLGATIKYWVRPDIENRIKAGQIRALFETRVTGRAKICA